MHKLPREPPNEIPPGNQNGEGLAESNSTSIYGYAFPPTLGFSFSPKFNKTLMMIEKVYDYVVITSHLAKK